MRGGGKRILAIRNRYGDRAPAGLSREAPPLC